jgi:hypothetical protein
MPYVPCMDDNRQADLPAVSILGTRPRFSMVILRMLDDDSRRGFSRLLYEVRRLSLKARKGSSRTLVADGIDLSSVDNDELFWINDDPYQSAAFVFVENGSPSWAAGESSLIDVAHSLVILFGKGPLVAVHSDSKSLLGVLQSWLDKSPRPPFRRITEGVLNAAFLSGGEARSMWLRGVHAPRSTKANSKHINGPKLQHALLHATDGTFAMGAARSLLPRDNGLENLRGIIGLTPRKSQIWHQVPVVPEEFFSQAADALTLLERVSEQGLSLDSPYPVLCTREEDLAGVKGAFDIWALPRSEVESRGDVDDGLLEAADQLEQAFIDIRPQRDSSSFVVDVGEDGIICGSLTGRIDTRRKSLSIKFGLSGEPTNPKPVRRILDALELYADELVTVYYESGHTALMRSIYRQNMRAAVFPNWIFEDFSGFDIAKEKPDTKQSQVIHDSIGLAADDSLFGWVVKRFNDGWLTCDDGSGEVADFVYVSNDGILSLIHVKGAKLNHPNRKIAVGPYEVVVSQAEKNIRYLTRDILIERLKHAPVSRPACWQFGMRANDREELILILSVLSPRVRTKVVVVQPHISQPLYAKAQQRPDDGTPVSPEALRMELLEALLNIAHAGIVGNGSDLFVIGSAT